MAGNHKWRLSEKGDSLKIAFQIDPVENLNITGDTSFALALEAQARGHDIFVYQPSALSWKEGRLYARAPKAAFQDVQGDHVKLDAAQKCDLKNFDVVMMRQNPPFDMRYITAAHFLEMIAHETLIINHPASVRNAPEKIFPLRFRQFMPPTLISSDIEDITAFRADYGAIVLKPLYGSGGEGVMLVEQNDMNFRAIAAMMLATYALPLIAQKFIPDIRKGDKRVFFVNGEPIAALNRVPPEGEMRANIQWGASFFVDQITPQEQKICDTLAPVLREEGFMLAGIDLIAEHLTEINITSPTGIRQIKDLGGPDIAAIAWDAIETKIIEINAGKN